MTAFDPILTVDDIVRGGACKSGVAKVLHRVWRKTRAAMRMSEILQLVAVGDREYVTQAGKSDGDGYGYGDGDGYGYGDGDGYGYGWAYASAA